MECLKINQVVWIPENRVLHVYLEDISLSISFFLPPYISQRNKWLRYKDVRYVFAIGSQSKYIYQSSNHIPIRDLTKFMKELVRLYEGNIGGLARVWFDKEKKTTKD